MRTATETKPGGRRYVYGPGLTLALGTALVAFSLSSPAPAASTDAPILTAEAQGLEFGPDAQVYDNKKKKKKKKKKRRGSFYSG